MFDHGVVASEVSADVLTLFLSARECMRAVSLGNYVQLFFCCVGLHKKHVEGRLLFVSVKSWRFVTFQLDVLLELDNVSSFLYLNISAI